MYAITGISGQVGGAVARHLLMGGQQSVRAVLRDADKAKRWRAQGAEVALATFDDQKALQAAFSGVDGVFVMIPPNFAPDPDFSETRRIVAKLHRALVEARPPKIVCLSSVGAQHRDKLGLITQLHILEQAFADLPMPIAFVRPAWFMENSQWDFPSAVEKGELPSFLQPLDRKIPMVATADIGRVIAEVLQQSWSGRRIIELEGPSRYSPNEVAAAFSRVLGRLVDAVAVPRSGWAELFGGSHPAPRIEMIDGFNSGWIDFEGGGAEHLAGHLSLDTVLTALHADYQESHRTAQAAKSGRHLDE